MSYEPKKVFVKTENGGYTEITYQEYKTLRETDKSFAERKFVRVYFDTLVEFGKKGAKELNEDYRRLRYIKKLDAAHKLTYYGSIYTGTFEETDPAVLTEKNELMKKLYECLDELEPIEQIIITGFYFDRIKEEELAKILGMTQSGISKRKRAILKKLRKKLAK